jgi:hypothetical protein
MKKTITILLLLAVFGLSGVVQAQIPTNGLVGYWPFNGNANDESGNNNDGTVNGAALTTDRNGNNNSAYYFDGVNDFIEVTHNSTLDFSSNDFLSVSFWINMESYPPSPYHDIVFSKQTGSGSSQCGFNINQVALYVGNSSGFETVGLSGSYPLNQWVHVVFVWGNGIKESYLNGVQVQSSTNSTEIGANTMNLLFGKANWSNINALPFNGKLDDIAIYNTALDSTEVLALYYEGVYTYLSINSTVCNSYTSPSGNHSWSSTGVYQDTVVVVSAADTVYTINLTVNQSTTASITETACDSYTAPDGAIYTTSGVKTAVIPNAAGCDSTITINLTVNQSTAETITETACDSYTAPDGTIYSTSGVKTAVIPNAAGCDSTITINLAVNQSTAETITETACDSYTAPDGTIYTTSGVKTAVIPNAAGCDSTITINLAVNQSTAETITETACDSYTAPDGAIYTTSGVKTAVIPNAAGCDSTITINLTVKQSTAETITETACDSYTAPDGAIYTTSGVKTAVIPNAAGCDSTITIHLTINTVDISVTNNDPILIANAYPATYQWIFCNNLLHISGATNQTFSPLANGYYACIITQNGCVDTTDCYSVATVGIIESSFENNILVYPNPTDGLIYVEFKESVKDITLDVFDNLGRIVLTKKFENIQRIETNIEGSTGLYTIRVSDANFSKTFLVSKIN